MHRTLLVMLAFCWFSATLPAEASPAQVSPAEASPASATPGTRPNVLLILADDLGFSDLGCYGSEIRTPHLDRLAEQGLRFTQFYNTARCWPTRAAILTGYYAQQVRRDQLPGVSLPMGVPGKRPLWAPLLPARLQPLGYRSYHSGKWHLDGKPLETGFHRSYSLNDHDRHFYPRQHTEDDQPLPPVAPGTGYYSSTAIANHAIQCLQDHAQHHAEKPFFSFLAFTAPHFPLQAPAEDIARYRDLYDQGWESLRERRWQKLQPLLPGATLAPFERSLGPPYHLPQAFDKLGPGEVNRPHPWGTLTDEQRRFQARKMAVHAAMVDRMDQEIGRVVEQLKTMNALENTLILFLSDNGATAEIMVRGDGHDRQAESGSGATFLSIGPGWSSLCNTPFRRHKTWVHEGGIATPCIVHWPQGLRRRGELRHTPAHVIDVVPTVLALAGSTAPPVSPGQPVPPSPGRSLLPAFESEVVIAREHLWWLHENNRALRQGNWKIVAAGQEAPWELYDLSQDRCETKNLAATHPAKVQELEAIWKRELAAMQELVQRP